MTTSVSLPNTVNSAPTGPSVSERPIADIFSESISVKTFGAVGDGVTDDTAAIQAAIDYAESVAGTFLGQYGCGVYFPDGIYRVTDTLWVKDDMVSLFARAPRSAALVLSADSRPLLQIGYESVIGNSDQVHGASLVNLSFRVAASIASTTTATGVLIHNATNGQIANCSFDGFNVNLDGRGMNAYDLYGLRFFQWQRPHGATKAEAHLSIMGNVYKDGTGGNCHIYDVLIYGSAKTHDPACVDGFRIQSVDTLHMDSIHIYKCVNNIHFCPDGTHGKNYIEAVNLSNFYGDENTGHAILIDGAVADLSNVQTPNAPGVAYGKAGLYQNMFFTAVYCRGRCAIGEVVENVTPSWTHAENVVKVAITGVGTVAAHDIQFHGGKLHQAGKTALLCLGSGNGCVNVEGLTVHDMAFSSNAQDEPLSSAPTAIRIQAKSSSIKNCNFRADANASSHIVQVASGITDVSIDIRDNNFSDSNCTDYPVRYPQSTGLNVRVEDNMVAGSGTSLKLNVTGQTSDATPLTLFSYPMAENQNGYLQARLIGRSGGGVFVAYDVSAHAGRAIGGSTTFAHPSDPVFLRSSESLGSSGADATWVIDGNDVKLVVTGIASSVILWKGEVIARMS